MIKWQTSGIAKAGKYGPAMVYAKEIAKYAEGIVGNEVQVFARIGTFAQLGFV